MLRNIFMTAVLSFGVAVPAFAADGCKSCECCKDKKCECCKDSACEKCCGSDGDSRKNEKKK